MVPTKENTFSGMIASNRPHENVSTLNISVITIRAIVGARPAVRIFRYVCPNLCRFGGDPLSDRPGSSLDTENEWRRPMIHLSLSEIRSERIDCPCRKLNPSILMVQSAKNWCRQNASDDLNSSRDGRILASEIDVCVRRCNSACTSEAGGADVARRTRRHDQDIRAGSNRSAVQHVHSATAIAAPLVGHVCPLSERVG